MNNNEELLRQCIASGQVSASQIEAHRQAGDLSDERSSGVTTQSPAVVKLEPLAVAYGEIPTDDNWISVAPAAKFKVGSLVTKVKGSQWTGRVVGTYSTTLTPEGYAVESSTERGSVQIYPAAALELVDGAQSAITSESSTPPAEQQAAPKAAPGEVSDTQHSQFLSDVLTAAGLITHGKQCKALGERLADMVMRLRAAPQPALAPLMPRGDSAASQLRAMATNYPPGHLWDKLDAKACIKGALEIEALRAALAAQKANTP